MSVFESALARGGPLALVSEASIDNGRLRGPAGPRDDGRCCQESVPERARGMAALGDVSASVWDLAGGRGSSRGLVTRLGLASFNRAPLDF